MNAKNKRTSRSRSMFVDSFSMKMKRDLLLSQKSCFFVVRSHENHQIVGGSSPILVGEGRSQVLGRESNRRGLDGRLRFFVRNRVDDHYDSVRSANAGSSQTPRSPTLSQLSEHDEAVDCRAARKRAARLSLVNDLSLPKIRIASTPHLAGRLETGPYKTNRIYFVS
jgi:hypothetical protein